MSITPAAPPQLGTTGREMYDNTAPAHYAEPETGYAWARFLGALSYLLDPIADVTRPADGSEPWTVLASPYRCPPAWLPVLAQWAGVKRWDAFTEADLRDLIATGGPGFWRGTRRYMIAQVRRFYGPDWKKDPPLYFEERADGDPYKLRMFVYRFVQPLDEAAIRQTLVRIKPAGLQPVIFEVRDGQMWRQIMTCGHTYWQVNEAYADWYDLLTHYVDPPDYPCRPAPPTPTVTLRAWGEFYDCIHTNEEVRDRYWGWWDVQWRIVGDPPCR